MNDDEALRAALRLATDPPGGVSVEALRELAGDSEADAWDIATTAAHLDVSAHTLRYYERIGLVDAARDASGRRQYGPAAVRRLVFITRMRVAGMPIADLQRYVALVAGGGETTGERVDMLLEHRETLRRQIAQLKLSLAVTEYKLTTYQEGLRP